MISKSRQMTKTLPVWEVYGGQSLWPGLRGDIARLLPAKLSADELAVILALL